MKHVYLVQDEFGLIQVFQNVSAAKKFVRLLKDVNAFSPRIEKVPIYKTAAAGVAHDKKHLKAYFGDVK